MSIFNYKAVLLKQENKKANYRFYPKYITFENTFGEFQIDLETWETEIISQTEIDNLDSFYCNERPVSALSYKIKRHFEDNGEIPKEAFHIA